MLQNLKALVVVMGLALIVFAVARPLCLRFMAPEDFTRRRNVWIALTVIAFASPNFWLYAVIAMAVFAWAARRDSNPLALYVMMLHVIPPIGLYIPAIGINHLFELNNYRMLSLAVLVPLAIRVMRAPAAHPAPKARIVGDAMLIGYFVLQLVLLMPYESITHTMRRGFLLTLDMVVIYYVFSRLCTSRHVIREVMASLVLICVIVVPIAAFESARGWLLYQNLGYRWGDVNDFSYLLRAGVLRAQVSFGHSLPMGYILAIGLGFSLYLTQWLRLRGLALALGIWMWIGLVAGYGRAPWLVAVLVFFAYLGLQPSGFVRFVKAGFVATALAAAVLVSPIGERVIDSLPFIGTVDHETVEYRKRLAEVSWRLIKQNPLLGNPFVLTQMEELRQGQGIIDLVNTYASVALLYGLSGLFLFVSIFLAGAWSARVMANRAAAAADHDLACMGAALLACMLGTLLMMATGSFGTGLAWGAWILAGMCAGYGALTEEQEALQPNLPPDEPQELPRPAFVPKGWAGNRL